MKAREAAVTREHFFDEDTRVSRAKEVNEAISGNCLGANFGSAFDGIQLSRFDAVEAGFGLIDVFNSSI
jgi:hypothetical protein